MLIWGLIISPTQSCHTQVGFFFPPLKHKALDIELIMVCDVIQDPFKIPQSSSTRTTSTSLWGQSSVIPTPFHGVPFLSAVLQSSLKPSNRFPLRHWAGLDLIPTQPTNAYVLSSPYQADDRKGALVVRLFESHGSSVTATLCTTLPVREAWRYLFLFLKFTAVCLYVEYSKNRSPPTSRCDLLERPDLSQPALITSQGITVSFLPFQIVSLLLILWFNCPMHQGVLV